MRIKQTIMKYLVVIFTFLVAHTNAQSISFSPTSVPIWGQIKNTAKVSIEYKGFKLVATKAFKSYWHDKHVEDEVPSYSPQEYERYVDQTKYSGMYFGLFYSPTIIEYGGLKIDAGAGLWNRRHPNKDGEYINFTVQASYQIHEHVSFEYTHHSNGFGIWNKVNPGIDHLSIQYHF